MDLMEVTPSLGRFDYIICHGVYSWVPAQVRTKVLEICRENLAEGGLATISYNTYPGWHARGMLREMLLYSLGRDQERPAGQAVKQARQYLAAIKPALARSTAGMVRYLSEQIAALEREPDTYLFHEYLLPNNDPVYFHEFAGELAAHGLKYVGDLKPSAIGPELGEALGRVAGDDAIKHEQQLDFLTSCAFRQSVVRRADGQDAPAGSVGFDGLYFASSARAVVASGGAAGEVSFRTADGSVLNSSDPLLVAALATLAEYWPRALRFAEALEAVASRVGNAAGLRGRPDALAGRLLICVSAGVAEVLAWPPAAATAIGQRPMVSALTRWEAARGNLVTTRLHRPAALSEELRAVAMRLDGTPDRDALARQWAAEGRDPAALGRALEELLKAPLLVE
jgi:hypothetical protein